MIFNVGDKVKLIEGTNTWAQYQDLENNIGVVTRLVDDGTSMKRISVKFDGIEEMQGVCSGLFVIA